MTKCEKMRVAPNAILNILTRPFVYRAFNELIGAPRARETYCREYLRARPGDRVLDIGCGTGEVLEPLRDVEYYGFDINPDYIAAARAKFPSRGTFECLDLAEARRHYPPASFDVISAHGVLHHVDDRLARELFELAALLLKPEIGRLVTVDSAFAEGQGAFDRFLVSNDRGCFVRPASDYHRLATAAFSEVTLSIRNNLIRLPFTLAILECRRNPTA